MRIRQAVKEETRAALVREGARLFTEQGFSATTVEQVTAAAGTAKGTFYNYFKTKEDLAVAVVLATHAQWMPERLRIAESPAPLEERLGELYAGAASWVNANPELTLVWCAERILHGRIDGPSQFSQTLARTIELGQQRGEARTDRPAILMALELEGIFLAYITAWYHTGRQHDLTQAMKQAIQTYLDGAKGGKKHADR